MKSIENELAKQSRYTDVKAEQLVKAIGKGLTMKASCEFASIPYKTFLSWMNSENALFDVLRLAVKKAQAKYKAKQIAVIEKAGEKAWTAAAWLLERTYQDEYSLKYAGIKGEQGVGNIEVKINFPIQNFHGMQMQGSVKQEENEQKEQIELARNSDQLVIEGLTPTVKLGANDGISVRAVKQLQVPQGTPLLKALPDNIAVVEDVQDGEIAKGESSQPVEPQP